MVKVLARWFISLRCEARSSRSLPGLRSRHASIVFSTMRHCFFQGTLPTLNQVCRRRRRSRSVPTKPLEIASLPTFHFPFIERITYYAEQGTNVRSLSALLCVMEKWKYRTFDSKSNLFLSCGLLFFLFSFSFNFSL